MKKGMVTNGGAPQDIRVLLQPNDYIYMGWYPNSVQAWGVYANNFPKFLQNFFYTTNLASEDLQLVVNSPLWSGIAMSANEPMIDGHTDMAQLADIINTQMVKVKAFAPGVKWLLPGGDHLRTPWMDGGIPLKLLYQKIMAANKPLLYGVHFHYYAPFGDFRPSTVTAFVQQWRDWVDDNLGPQFKLYLTEVGLDGQCVNDPRATLYPKLIWDALSKQGLLEYMGWYCQVPQPPGPVVHLQETGGGPTPP